MQVPNDATKLVRQFLCSVEFVISEWSGIPWVLDGRLPKNREDAALRRLFKTARLVLHAWCKTSPINCRLKIERSSGKSYVLILQQRNDNTVEPYKREIPKGLGSALKLVHTRIEWTNREDVLETALQVKSCLTHLEKEIELHNSSSTGHNIDQHASVNTDRNRSDTSEDAANRRRPVVIINLRTNRVTIGTETKRYSKRIATALAFALKSQKGISGPSKQYFDRRELCTVLDINETTKIRDIFRGTLFIEGQPSNRILKKFHGVKNAYCLDIDIKKSCIEE